MCTSLILTVFINDANLIFILQFYTCTVFLLRNKIEVFLFTIAHGTYLHPSFLISLIFVSSYSLSFAFIIPSLRLLRQRLGTLALEK